MQFCCVVYLCSSTMCYIRSKIRSIVLTTCEHTFVKLGNLSNNKADNSYTAEHIKKLDLFL